MGHIPHQQLQVQNVAVQVGLIKLIKSTNLVNHEPFFKHCILETVLLLHVFFHFYICVEKNYLSRKKNYFRFIWFDLGERSVLKVLGVANIKFW